MSDTTQPVYETTNWRRINHRESSLEAGFLAHLREIAGPTQEAYQGLMATYGGNPTGVECSSAPQKGGSRSWAFVAPNPPMVDPDRSASPWRVQYFDRDSFSGHEGYATIEEAVESMLRSGYRTPDPGALDREAATPRWALGVRRMAVMQQHQSGLIDWPTTVAALNELAEAAPPAAAELQEAPASTGKGAYALNNRSNGIFADGYVDCEGLPVGDTFAYRLHAITFGESARDCPKERLAVFIARYTSAQLAELASGQEPHEGSLEGDADGLADGDAYGLAYAEDLNDEACESGSADVPRP